MEQELTLPSEENYEKVREMLSEANLDLESEDEIQLIEMLMAQDESDRTAVLASCIKTMLTLIQQATRLIKVSDTVDLRISQWQDETGGEPTGFNYDKKQLEFFQLNTEKIVDEHVQQLEKIFDVQLNLLNYFAAGYDRNIEEILKETSSSNFRLLDLFKEMTKVFESSTAANENLTHELTISTLKRELILTMTEINRNQSESIRKTKAKAIEHVELLQKSLPSHGNDKFTQLENLKKKFETKYRLRMRKLVSAQSQIEDIKLTDEKRESQHQNQISMMISAIEDIESKLSSYKQMLAESWKQQSS